MAQHNTPSNRFSRTKMIATLGPGSNSYETIKELVLQGANVFRLNSSHGTHEEMQDAIDKVRAVSEELTTHIGLLQDLQGPKIRVGEIENGEVPIEEGQQLTITPVTCIGSSQKVSTTYQYLAQDVKEGDTILVDDGKLSLKVVAIKDKEVITEVVYGGMLRSKKGMNLPYTVLSTPSLTKKDREDLVIGLQNDVEWMALSFVREAKDVIELKEIIEQQGKMTKVVAKIEKPEALQNIDDIIAHADALMVARGDLGVEIPMQQVPVAQKEIVKKCNKAGKPVIIATQMMDSMVENPIPTRAEINDIANAVMDGADALMLSNETAVGKYPVETVKRLRDAVLYVEDEVDIYHRYHPLDHDSPSFHSGSLIQAACRLGEIAQAKAIVGMTWAGYAAFEISKNRPKADIFIFTDNKPILNTLTLAWGIRGYYYTKSTSTDQTFADIEKVLVRKGHLKPGDVFITTAAMPINIKQHSNTLKINVVPE